MTIINNFDRPHLCLWLLLLSISIRQSLTLPLESIGKAISLPFPNEQTILGVSGLTYDESSGVWTVSAESIRGSSIDKDFPLASAPRIYRVTLDFDDGSIDFVDESAILVNPSEGLKLEDIGMTVSSGRINGENANLEKQFWLVSESSSQLVRTNTFFSRDFGAPDLSTYDPDTFSTSRLLRIDENTGEILEDAAIPNFALWEPQEHNWDAMECVGDRPFQGLHAITIIEAPEEDYDNIMLVAFQSALYQDGSSPTDFQGSATRVLMFGLNNSDPGTSSETAQFLRSYRYDTSQLTIDSYQRGARHFNALSGIVALNSTSLLVAECEDHLGFGSAGHQVVNRIFHVTLDTDKTVDHCGSLLRCNITAPQKKLIWERDDDKQLDGIALGPVIKGEDDQAYRTIALTFENDNNVGVHFELYRLNVEELDDAEIWQQVNNKDNILQRRIIAVSVSIAIVLILVVVQILWIRCLSAKGKPKRIVISNPDAPEEQVVESKKFTFAEYAMASALLNSFLVGAITFGFSGMLLILRKEGIYAEMCACGSFCSKEKEQLAVISSLGFAVSIGSRLFVGMFLDSQGPKTTAILCSSICLSGFVLLASTPKENTAEYFMSVWLLIAFGGSGLHLTGFHLTNLFKGDAKKLASIGLSAACGSSSIIFPIMQVLNQYGNMELQHMAIFCSVVVFLLGVNNFLIQPWSKVVPGVPLKPDFRVWRPQWWKRGLKKKPLISPSVLKKMANFDMWGDTFTYSVSLLVLTHFLSTSAQFLHEKGDIPFTTNPNDWSDYMFTRMAGWFNSLGFIWFPLVQWMVTNFRWSTNYFILFSANMFVVLIIITGSLELQTLGFMVLCMARLMLFSFHHTFLLNKFGIENFGTLNGISNLVAALIGLLSYPLQLYGLSANFSMSFIPVGFAVLLSAAFPIYLRFHKVSNWAESYAVDPRKIRYPRGTRELVELVKRSSKIRCAGSMQSCAPLVASEGIVLSLDKFDQIIQIDVERMIAIVQPGVKIHSFCAALAPYGLAIGDLGTIDWQSIGGAVMTGTHGGSLTTPSIHTFVNSYTLVKHDGTIVIVDREKDPELFLAMAPSLGLFGVVIEMEIRCTKLEYLEARMEAMSFSGLISRFEDIMRTNKHARVIVYPSIMQATVWTANPVDKGEAVSRGAAKSKGYVNFRDEAERALLEKILRFNERGNYKKADELLRNVVASQLKRLNHYEGQYNHVLCNERNNGIPHADIEFAFDFEKHSQVLHTVKNYCESNRIPYYNFDIRATRSDDAMLSCCYGQDTMWIEFQAKPNSSREFFNDISSILEPIEYRKHWAKGMGNPHPINELDRFPMAKNFMHLLEEFDPRGKFCSRLMADDTLKLDENLGSTMNLSSSFQSTDIFMEAIVEGDDVIEDGIDL